MANLPQNAVLHKGDRPAGNPDPDYVVTIQGVDGAYPIPTSTAAVQPTEDAADGTIGATFGDIVIGIGGEDTVSGEYTPATFTSGKLNVNEATPTLNATGQVSITNAATQIIAANSARSGVLITNPSTTVTVYVGLSGVTTSTGAILSPGASLTLPVTSAIYGIVATGSQTVSYVEVV